MRAENGWGLAACGERMGEMTSKHDTAGGGDQAATFVSGQIIEAALFLCVEIQGKTHSESVRRHC